MKTAFIFVLFKTPKSEVERLKKEAKEIGLSNYTVYFIDNTNTGKGYAEGVNEGIEKAQKEDIDLFIIANPDISIKNITKNHLLEDEKQFDIWGFPFRQEETIYYEGKIDKHRMSGGFLTKKPEKRFISSDFISGSFMAIKKEVIEKIGLFDESYFMYYEDVDFCLRAKNANFKIGIDSSTFYDHFEISKTNPEKDIYLAKNRLRFLLKYGTWKQKLREFIRSPKTIIEERTLLQNLFATNNSVLNFSILNISSIGIKLLSFVLFLFLTRLLPVEEYGVYTLVWAHVGLLLPFLDFGTTTYGLINISQERKKHLHALFTFRLYISIIVFIATFLLAFIFQYELSIIFYILLIEFTIFTSTLSGTYLITTSIVRKPYKSSLISFLFNLILTPILILSLIFSQSLGVVFIATFILYNLYSLFNVYLLKNDVNFQNLKPNLTEWKEITKKSYIYVLIALFAGIYFKIDVILLKILKNEAQVGIYSTGYKFFEATMFLSSSYNFASAPLLVKLYSENKKRFFSKVKQDTIFLLTVGLIIAILVFVLAPIILPFILKSTYVQGIQVLQIVIFALPCILISTIYLNSLYVFNKAKYIVGLFLFQTVFSTALNIIFIPLYSFYASAYITVASEVINAIILVFLFYRIGKSNQS